MTDLRAALHATPVGEVLIVADGERIVELHPLRESMDESVTRIAATRAVAVIPKTSKTTNAARRQLDEYFAGRRRHFSLPLAWEELRGFTRKALQAVCDIPYGETAGYGEVAAMAGSPRAARAVGTACATTPFSIVVPVHRVIRADGSLGEYGGRPEVKAQLLRLEEAAVEQADRVSAG